MAGMCEFYNVIDHLVCWLVVYKESQQNRGDGIQKANQKDYVTRLRQEDNIRMNIKEIGINTREKVDFAQDRYYSRALVNAALNLRFHKSGSQLVIIKFYEICAFPVIMMRNIIKEKFCEI